MKLSETVRNITPQKLLSVAKSTFLRFPESVVMILLLTVDSLILVHGYYTDRKGFLLTYFPSVAIFVNILVSLFCANKSRIVRIATSVVVNLLWLLYSYLAYRFFIKTAMGALSVVSVTMVWLMLFFCYPSFRKKDDLSTWRFGIGSVVSLFISSLMAYLMVGGLSLLLWGSSELFGFHVDEKFYLDIWILCTTVLVPSIMLTQIPRNDELEREREFESNRFVTGLITHLLIPLQFLYMLILYIYAAKILFTLTLPCGWTSVLISISMLGMVLLQILLYPMCFSEEQTFAKKFMRLVPMFMLPLLVLMSIGIVRRISDYGITIPRLYLLAANVWFYAVCVYLIVTRSRRFSGIPISLVVLFFVLSSGPQSIPNLTLSILKRQVKTIFTENNIDLPIDQKKYSELNGLYGANSDLLADALVASDAADSVVQKAKNKKMMSAISKFRYIINTYELDDFRDLATENISAWKTNSVDVDESLFIDNSMTLVEDVSYYASDDLDFEIDEKYSHISKFEIDNYDIFDSTIQSNSVMLPIMLNDDVNRYVSLDLKELMRIDSSGENLCIKNDSSFVVFNRLYLNVRKGNRSYIDAGGVWLRK